jgi:hypothetical protein
MVFSVKGSKNHAFEGNASLTAPDSVGERRCNGMVPSLAPPPRGVGTLQRSSEDPDYKSKPWKDHGGVWRAPTAQRALAIHCREGSTMAVCNFLL